MTQHLIVVLSKMGVINMFKVFLGLLILSIGLYANASNCDSILQKFDKQKFTEIININDNLTDTLLYKSIIYYWGIGTDANQAKAYEILNKISNTDIESFIKNLYQDAKEGCGIANVVLGIIYFEGNFYKFKRSLSKSKSKFLQMPNNPISKLGLSAILYEKDKVKSARIKIVELINEKVNDALSIAIMIESGIVFKKNIEEAFYWYHIAGKSGDYNAYGTLGYMYATGYGVKKDSIKARFWFNMQSNDPEHIQSQSPVQIDSIINSDFNKK